MASDHRWDIQGTMLPVRMARVSWQKQCHVAVGEVEAYISRRSPLGGTQFGSLW